MTVHFAAGEDYKTRKAVVAEYPGAAKIVKVTGGWAVFGTITDYNTWHKQR